MDFRELARIGAEPSPTPLGAFVVEHLEKHGAARRVDLINAAKSEWRAISGQDMTASLTSRMKKALSMLEQQGSVRKTGAYGRYELAATGDVVLEDIAEANDEDIATELDEEDQPGTEPEIVIGEGDQSVYCYYLEAYRQRSESSGQDRWPIKIGMTTGEVRHRMAQHATAMPERPTVAVVLQTPDAALLERLLHLVLTYKGHRDQNSGGAEWFITNPKEIVAIHAWLSGTQNDSQKTSPPATEGAALRDDQLAILAD